MLIRAYKWFRRRCGREILKQFFGHVTCNRQMCAENKLGGYCTNPVETAGEERSVHLVKTNCSLDLTETQRGDIVQHLLRDATQLDH